MRALRVTFASLAAASGVAVLPPIGSAAPARLQVVEKEYSLTMSRLKVVGSSVTVQVVNFGMDNHNLVILGKAKGSKPITFATLAPGAQTTKTLKLAPGKYTLFCGLPGHRALGMVAPLTVVR